MDLLIVKIKSGQPFLSIQRDLVNYDLAPVIERENSIMFMMDDDAWENLGDHYQISLRLRVAGDLDRELRELNKKHSIKMDQVHYTHLASICKVYKNTTHSQDAKEAVEAKHFTDSLLCIEQAITDFNLHSMMRGI
jgi:hypothetical protein